MNVPYQNLERLHQPDQAAFEAAIQRVISSGDFTGGRFVQSFEDSFANYCGSRHCIGVGSGTEALWLALLACGIGPGDEVITVANTYVATVEAIVQTGAKPVFVDIEEDSHLLDASKLRAALSERTKAIIPVHLYGQMARMELISAFAKAHQLRVIEDASQAHGATRLSRKAGSWGDLGCFSFYPTKNLGAFGDAGAIVTNDLELADRLRSLREHGQSTKNQHHRFGWNCRMDSIQAAILELKLTQLDRWNSLRHEVALRYQEQLIPAHPTIELPITLAENEHTYHAFVLRSTNRDLLKSQLSEAGIQTLIHYPRAIHQQEAYRHFAPTAGTLPVTEQLVSEILSLPCHPHLTRDEQTYITNTIHDASIQQLAA